MAVVHGNAEIDANFMTAAECASAQRAILHIAMQVLQERARQRQKLKDRNAKLETWQKF